MGGERKLGDYTLVRELGRGGMGVVWAARHPRFGDVALKVVLDAGLGDPEGVARMRRESAALLRLSHENVVGVHEVAEAGGHPFVAMAFVGGESLHDRLRRGPLDGPEAARVTLGIARALTHIHSQGVLHRDLKPHNVLIRSDGEPVLVDFGLARLTLDRQRLTSTGQAVGTPAYMSPEQAMGGAAHLTSAVDVYGLGATFYEMLCGVPPFTGANPLAIMSKVLEEAPPPPSQVNPKLDRELEQLCLRCLEKDPARRPEAAELADALAAWRDSHVSAGRRRRGRPRPASSRAPLAVAAAALVVTALFATRGDEPARTPTPTEVAAVPTAVVVVAPADPVPPAAVVDPDVAALDLLRSAVPLSTHGREAAREALAQAVEAERLSPTSARVLLTCAWVTRSAARAGAPGADLAHAAALVTRAAQAGASTEDVERLRATLETDQADLATYAELARTAVSVEEKLSLGRFCRKLGRREEAAELLLAGGDDFQAAGELWHMGRLDAARDVYEEVLAEAMAYVFEHEAARYALWCHMRLVELSNDAGRFEDSLRHVEGAFRLPREVEGKTVFVNDDAPKLGLQHALALLGIQRWREALETVDGAAPFFSPPDPVTAVLITAMRAEALARLAPPDEARAELTRALQLARALPLEHTNTKILACKISRRTFPDDSELDALARAAFP